MFAAVVPSERLAEVQGRLAVSSLVRRTDGVHVRFAGDGVALPGARPVEPTLEDAYLLTNLDAGAEAGDPAAAADRAAARS